jgi:energy-converting hydrogenase Eha subunit C
LKKITKIHLEVISLKEMAEKILSPVLFIQFMQCSCAIGSTGLEIIKTNRVFEKIIMFRFLMQGLLQVLSICYFGEQISDANLKVGNLIYDNILKHKNLRFRKTCLMIMLHSQRELKIRARGFKKISRTTFTFVWLSIAFACAH